MRAQPQIAKGALSRRMQIRGEKELEDTYQLLKSFIQPKPYPSFEGFQTVLDDLAKRIPAAKTADPKQFVDAGLSTRWIAPDTSTRCTNRAGPRMESCDIFIVGGASRASARFCTAAG
jgi:hypothetical protein